MKLEDVIIKYKKFEESGRLPPALFWPRELVFPKNIWKIVGELKKKTAMKGYEYTANVVDVHGELICSPVQGGNNKSVKALQRFGLRYIKKNANVYEKQIFINDIIYKKSKVNSSDLNQKNPPYVKNILNIHSHPASRNILGQEVYSFFSDTDINSFLASSSVIMGLVTDMFWLVGKTENMIASIGQNGLEMLERISRHAFEGDMHFDDVLKNEMNKWGLVFFRGHIGYPLSRVF